MLVVEEVAHGEDVGRVRLGEELEVGVVVGLAAGVVDAELCGELVVDVYDGNDGVGAEVEVRLGGGDGLGGGGEVWRYAEVTLGGAVLVSGGMRSAVR